MYTVEIIFLDEDQYNSLSVKLPNMMNVISFLQFIYDFDSRTTSITIHYPKKEK